MRRNLPYILIRILVGLVFITEGILKFLHPGELGAGRFARIGLPIPYVLAPFVGMVEIVCGVAVLLNFYTGPAVVLLLCVITTALFTTKVPILLGRAVGPFRSAGSAQHGVLAFIHEARTDLAMLFCLVAILMDSGVRFARTKQRR